MNNFPFSSVRSALEWYFRKSWIKPPPDAKAIPLVKVQSSPKNDDAQIVFRAHSGITRALNRLAPRNWHIIAAEFNASPYTQSRLAEQYDLAGGDRSVRYIRDRCLIQIDKELTSSGIISRGRMEEPRYARDEE